MNYYVTSGGFAAKGKRATAAIDIPRKRLKLSDALAHACQLLANGETNVAIQDGDGHNIAGDELAACCRREKSLSPDLRAS